MLGSHFGGALRTHFRPSRPSYVLLVMVAVACPLHPHHRRRSPSLSFIIEVGDGHLQGTVLGGCAFYNPKGVANVCEAWNMELSAIDMALDIFNGVIDFCNPDFLLSDWQLPSDEIIHLVNRAATPWLIL